ncbi:DUF4386 domain-containing protein [Arthrobacter castelli]|uniref:DUF4386 domain-containing protein n=1 Tax=Arthrobacter castelli TaxID=271431 RepID=UPI0003F8C7F0|nr:DUF4386 domain-containing protein [Arthrobacter castelli]
MNSTITIRTAGDRWMRNAWLTAGAGMLLMIPLSVFPELIVFESLVTPGDAAQTAADIAAPAQLFRLGVLSLLVVVALDVVVAWSLYYVFRPVSEALSLLAAWFRLLYSGVFMVAISHLMAVPPLVGNGNLVGRGAAQRQEQALLRVETFTDIRDAGLILFGLHLLVIGYLACRSGSVPTVIGILLVIAGAGYAFDSVIAVVSASPSITLTYVTFLGELLLALWLVFRSRRVSH